MNMYTHAQISTNATDTSCAIWLVSVSWHAVIWQVGMQVIEGSGC